MKVLMLNGSPHKEGCTYTALCEIGKALNDEGVDYEIVWLGNGPVADCIGCHGCRGTGKCVFTGDALDEIYPRLDEADGFVFGTPVYYAHPSGRVLSVLDRLFYSSGRSFAHKPGAAVASARRAGTTASLDAMNKYFTIAQMPVVSSTYWNMVHGNSPADVAQDIEGLRIMRNIGHNMAWLLKCIEAGKVSGIAVPEAERGPQTNFIR